MITGAIESVDIQWGEIIPKAIPGFKTVDVIPFKGDAFQWRLEPREVCLTEEQKTGLRDGETLEAVMAKIAELPIPEQKILIDEIFSVMPEVLAETSGEIRAIGE